MVKQNRDKILSRIKSATEKSTHKTNVQILAVSKKQPIEKIREAYNAGQSRFAENYVQEFLEKKNEFSEEKIEWHLIGPLQTNKVSKVVGEVYLIHSVDSLKLAKAISEKALDKKIKQKILIQINVSGEKSKSGIDMEMAGTLIPEILKLPGLDVVGLMTMPPFTGEPESSREYFRNLRRLRDEYRKNGIVELSMGTTQDFEVAIEEGATIIRVGEALFGPRKN